MQLKSLLWQILRDDRGATAVEYGLIVSLVVLGILGAVESVASANTDQWNYIKSTIDNAINGAEVD